MIGFAHHSGDRQAGIASAHVVDEVRSGEAMEVEHRLSTGAEDVHRDGDVEVPSGAELEERCLADIDVEVLAGLVDVTPCDLGARRQLGVGERKPVRQALEHVVRRLSARCTRENSLDERLQSPVAHLR